jgi:tetraacyldisaccharide 4'-kinase
MQNPLTRTVIDWLESPAGRLRALVGAPWSHLAPVSRIHLSETRVPVVGIGGATLGGSGRTPLVIACAEALSPYRRVAIVSHGYAASTRNARRVHLGDPVSLVGDEALLLAARVPNAHVFVGAQRMPTLRLASEHADLVLVDGLLQTWPHRVSLSILTVDSTRPWGSEACLPGGDLRASKTRLQAAADMTVTLGGSAADPFAAHSVLSVSPWSSKPFSMERSLSSLVAQSQVLQMGLFTAIARSGRFECALSERGFRFHTKIRARDHRPLEAVDSARTMNASIDAWIITEKCLFGLGGIERAEYLLGAPVCVIRQTLTVPYTLADWMTRHLRD